MIDLTRYDRMKQGVEILAEGMGYKSAGILIAMCEEMRMLATEINEHERKTTCICKFEDQAKSGRSVVPMYNCPIHGLGLRSSGA
jgi:hypothetical protein